MFKTLKENTSVNSLQVSEIPPSQLSPSTPVRNTAATQNLSAPSVMPPPSAHDTPCTIKLEENYHRKSYTEVLNSRTATTCSLGGSADTRPPFGSMAADLPPETFVPRKDPVLPDITSTLPLNDVVVALIEKNDLLLFPLLALSLLLPFVPIILHHPSQNLT